jgi:DNA-binding CsgD family transcriptional regulator
MSLPNQPVVDSVSPNNEPTLEKKIKALEAIDYVLPVVIIVLSLADLSVVYMSETGRKILGATLDELKAMGAAYRLYFFNPEDEQDYTPKIVEAIQSPERDKVVGFFQQVRPSPLHDWKWYLTSCKVFIRTPQEQATYIICTASLIDPEHAVTSKVNRLLEEKNFRRCQQPQVGSLTQREKQLLAHFALGKTSSEIAKETHLSEQTVTTHRRNIKNKINAQMNYDLTYFAQAFDLI